MLYPGWWVDPPPKGVEVWVLNPEALPTFVSHEYVVFRDDQVKLFASALETYMRSSAQVAR